MNFADAGIAYYDLGSEMGHFGKEKVNFYDGLLLSLDPGRRAIYQLYDFDDV